MFEVEEECARMLDILNIVRRQPLYHNVHSA